MDDKRQPGPEPHGEAYHFDEPRSRLHKGDNGQAVPPAAGPERMLHEIERLQREINHLSQELAQSHRLATLGTLAAAAAHEVNNILTPVVSYAQLAQQRPEDSALTAKALQLAADNGHRATRLFTATLEYAKPASDHPQGADDQPAKQQTCTDPATALQQALDCMPREPQRDGISLRTNFEPQQLAIDPLELQQVLLNLLLNARKALMDSRTRRPEIAIVGQASENKGGTYILQIKDNGPGIPAKLLGRAFEPFVTQNADGHAASNEKTGTGLGLAVCRRLIEKAGGNITCENPTTGGAVFTITIPIA